MNRRTLENEMRVLLRQKTPFALAIADLDLFKQLNDKHGHETGDRSLRGFALTMRRTLRDVDLVGRWGGEEFVIVMPGADCKLAVGVLDRIRESLAGSHQGTHPNFTASFGVTDSTMADTLERLIMLADSALYASKNSGRDRVTIADPLAVPPTVEQPSGNGLRKATTALSDDSQ